ncbi:SET domain-containing protein 4 [Drosophila tropicalis]|uniref:SET domain-containing protein 4 n=1 Tax=Drosophila tropicalis TaxID=46794 RepID=UPI0035ABCFE7
MGRTERHRQRRGHSLTSIESSPAINQSFHALCVELNKQGWLNQTQLSARIYDSTGRGLCSKRRSFHPGDELIRLPVQCLISIATLQTDEQFKNLFNKDLFDKDSRMSFQSLMACYLMYHTHLNESTSSGCSELSAYGKTLPRTYSTPYFCSMSELQCLPEALLERTVAQNRQIRDDYQILKTLVGAAACDCCNQTYCQDIWSLSDFRLAYFAVNSRSVYVNASQLMLQMKLKSEHNHFRDLIKGDTNLALAPFLDLFNHCDAVETSARLEGKEYCITLHEASKVIDPYSQIFISYGALPNFKLLTEYGFWLEHNSHDYFEFKLLDIEQLIRYSKSLCSQSYHRNIFKFIREHNLDDQMFVHLDDGCSHNLRVVLHIIFHQDSYFPNVLNQIAFGDANQFDNVQPELDYLVTYKIKEYQEFATALERLPQLTESGIVARTYLLECVRYLGDFMAKHCPPIQ